MDAKLKDKCLAAVREYLKARDFTIIAEPRMTPNDPIVGHFAMDILAKHKDTLYGLDLSIKDDAGNILLNHTADGAMALAQQRIFELIDVAYLDLEDFCEITHVQRDTIELTVATDRDRLYIRRYIGAMTPIYEREKTRQLKTLIYCYNDYIQSAFDDPDKIASGWVPVCIDEFAESEEFANMRGR